MKTITLKTKGLTDVVDVTDLVQKEIDEAEAEDGVIHLFALGSTTGLTTIEADPNLYKDLAEALEAFSPYKKKWRHGATWGEDNGASRQTLSWNMAENRIHRFRYPSA